MTEIKSRWLSRAMLAVFLFLLADILYRAFCFGRSFRPELCTAMTAALTLFLLLLFVRWKWGGTFRTTCERQSTKRLYGWLTALCFLTNLLFVLTVHVEPVSDADMFWTTACDIANGEGVTYPVYLAYFPHICGYASFLGLFLRLFGTGKQVAPLLNVLLTVGTGSALFFLVLRRCGKTEAVLAYGLWILYPTKTFFNVMVLSEPLYTCLMTVYLLLLSRLDAEREMGLKTVVSALLWGLLLGALLRAINLVRPVAAILIIATVIWLLFLDKRFFWRSFGGQWLPLLLAMLLSYAALGSVWNAHLTDLLGEEPATTPGYSLYVGFNMQTQGQYNPEDMQLMGRYEAEPGMNASSAQERMFEEFRGRLHSEDLRILWLLRNKLAIFSGSDDYAAGYVAGSISAAEGVLFSLLSNVVYYSFLLAAGLAATKALRRPESSSLLIAPLYVIGLSMAHMLVEVAPRYHYSFVPMLILTLCTVAYREKE